MSKVQGENQGQDNEGKRQQRQGGSYGLGNDISEYC